MLLLRLYMGMYNICKDMRLLFFSMINKLTFVYFIGDTDITNVTLRYYLGYGLSNYQTGTYYVRTHDKFGTSYLTFTGNITEIPHLNSYSISELTPPLRKNIILLDNNTIIDVDLDILDNYIINIQNSDTYVTNMKLILELMGIDCTHIKIIQLRPFSAVILDADQVSIYDLYN